MKLYAVNNGTFKLDGGAMFGVVPKSMWNKNQIADENNQVEWALRCLLVVFEEKKILIDTGIGNKQSEKFFSHYFLKGETFIVNNLDGLGFERGDITDVIITHFHFDHSGGAVELVGDDYVPTFPNATYWTAEKQLDWALNPNAKEKASFLKENIQPLLDAHCLKFIEKGNSPFKNISFYWANGHTESQLLPIIEYKGKKIAYVADLFPSVQHLSIPWVMSYDTRPLLTLTEKEEFLSMAVKEEIIFFFEHDVDNECCTVCVENGRYKADKIFPFISI